MLSDRLLSPRFSLSLIFFLIFLFLFGCVGCSGDGTSDSNHGKSSGTDVDGDSEEPPETYVIGQALLGPLIGAEVDLYPYDDLKTAIYTTTTSESTTLAEAGFFDIPENVLDDNMLYVIEVTGGSDIDADDDGVVDELSTDNLGTLHLVATGSQLKIGNFKANILTDIIYYKVSYLIMARYPPEVIRDEINLYSKTLLADDINGDGKTDINDILQWSPGPDMAGALPNKWFLEKCIEAVHSSTYYQYWLSTFYRHTVAFSTGMTEIFDRYVISGHYAYLAWNDGIQVVDIVDPIHPVALGNIYMSSGDNIRGIFASGNYIYLNIVNGMHDGYACLVVIDVSDPADPITLRRIHSNAGFDDISGNYAYLADGDSGLRIIDVNNPVDPVNIATVDTPDKAIDVAVSGNYAYVVDSSSGLQIVDISNPALSHIIGAVDIPGDIFWISVSGGYAYVMSSGFGIQVIDVRDQENPSIVGAINLSANDSRFTVSGNYAYLSIEYLGVYVIDMSTPSDPKIIDFIDTYSDMGAFVVSGDYAYAANRVIDIGAPGNPSILGTVAMPGPPDAVDIVIYGNYAYMAASRGLLVVDVSDLKNPIITSTVDTPSSATSVASSGRYIYVADYSGLRVIDATDPAYPAVIYSFDTTAPVHGIAIVDGYLYAANDSNGLSIFDIRYGENPILTATIELPKNNFDLPGTAYDVVVSGNYAYVADSRSGIHIFDVSNPADPIIIGSVETPGNARAITVSGNYAYVADGSGLQIINIGNPAYPVMVDSINAQWMIQDVAISGHVVYATDETAGVIIIDIKNPPNSNIVGTIDPLGYASSVTVSNDHLFVTGYNSLAIYRAITDE